MIVILIVMFASGCDVGYNHNVGFSGILIEWAISTSSRLVCLLCDLTTSQHTYVLYLKDKKYVATLYKNSLLPGLRHLKLLNIRWVLTLDGMYTCTYILKQTNSELIRNITL